jgi:hypothetical protein
MSEADFEAAADFISWARTLHKPSDRCFESCSGQDHMYEEFFVQSGVTLRLLWFMFAEPTHLQETFKQKEIILGKILVLVPFCHSSGIRLSPTSLTSLSSFLWTLLDGDIQPLLETLPSNRRSTPQIPQSNRVQPARY